LDGLDEVLKANALDDFIISEDSERAKLPQMVVNKKVRAVE